MSDRKRESPNSHQYEYRKHIPYSFSIHQSVTNESDYESTTPSRMLRIQSLNGGGHGLALPIGRVE